MQGLLAACHIMIVAAAGILAGFSLPVKHFGNRPGFMFGVLIGSPFTLLGGLLAASLFGGLLEQLLESAIGVVIGIGIGSFIGVFALCCLFGFAGTLLRTHD